ncbi:MAG: hypothetical protein H7839_02610 [Magnetococcus sp. YQC-5]
MRPSKIHQLQASYSPIQDRLLLRVNTSEKMEFRFWLTRRFVQRLWPALRQTLEAQPALAEVEGNTRGALLSFMHQHATEQADFQAPFQETTETITPLGPEPILVAQAAIRMADQNEQLRMLSLHPENGYGIEIAMELHLVHAFCKLLADVLATTDWQLHLGFTQMPAIQEMTMTGGRVLH